MPILLLLVSALDKKVYGYLYEDEVVAECWLMQRRFLEQAHETQQI